jgi:secernin
VDLGQPLDLGPAPTERYDPSSLWWRHERLHRLAMRDPERLLPMFCDARDELERAWLATPPEPEAAFAEADAALSHWTALVERAAGRDTRPAFVRRYWRVRDGRAALPVPVGPLGATR